ncbi:MAG: DUF3343 domain-containing protein [Chitinophagales bacterium]
METDYRYYILFPNHNEGLRLNRELKQKGIKNTIAPTPRAARSSCGISLIVEAEDLQEVEAIIKDTGVLVEKIVKLPVTKDWQFRGL